jgi:hypothetical protein
MPTGKPSTRDFRGTLVEAVQREVSSEVAELRTCWTRTKTAVLSAKMKAQDFVVSLLIAALCACAQRPSPFIDGLSEGMSEVEALRQLRVEPNRYKVQYEMHLDAKDKRPPYSEKAISIAHARCAGQDAEIWLSFYLGQLREVTCYPTSANSLILELVKRGIIEKVDRNFERTMGKTSIHGGNAFDGRWKVSFSSKRLTRKQRDWIDRYS